jgi:hypothetical protein
MSFFSIEKISGLSTFDVDTSGALQINSSAGAISIGNDDIDAAINIGTQGERTISIGTGSFADTVAIGNATGATAVTITSGTGDIVASSTDAVTIDAAGVLELNSSAGAISIGNDDIDQAINIGTQGERTISIGTGSFADTVAIGNATGATAVTITSGTGDIVASSTDAVTIDAAGVLELNSSAGVIGIGNDAVAQAINIGNGGAARTITIGNSTGATAVNLTTGTGGFTLTTDTATFTSANSTDPLVVIKNTTNDVNGARLQFVKDRGAAGDDGDDIGVIEFVGGDAVQAQTTFAKIVAEVSTAVDTDEAGKLTFYVAESDGTTTALAAGLILEGEHATNGEVDVTIANGTASTTTVSGELNVTTISNANTDTDKFLVSASGALKFRTGTEIASDIGAVSTATNNTFTGTNTFATTLFTPQIVDVTDTTATGDLTISASVVLLTVTDSSGTDDRTFTIPAGTTGQLVHFFFTGQGGSDETRNVILDFRISATDYLYSGSGLHRYLTFSVTGQSASLIYINDTSTNNKDGWRIINTGAAVS